jgi:transcriptional regulator with XRE-family HTH domain
MKDRINTLIKAMNYTATQFADEIGVQKSGISHILSGRNNPSLDFIQKILQRFPEVNMEWLVMGRGSMIGNEPDGNLRSATTVFPSQQSQNQPLDLFSPPISPASVVDQSVFKQEQNETVKEEPVSPSVEKSRPSGNERLKEEENIPYGEKRKRIDKIIVFYSDRTFVEFTQGN